MADFGGNTDQTRAQLALDAEARAAGITLTPDCGQVPGLGNSLCAYTMSLFDECHDLIMYDGGIPLVIGYAGALVLAMYDAVRIALTSRDRALAYWAAVIAAMNLGTVASCFGFNTFISPIGVQFWALAGALHGADRRVRDAARKKG